MSLASSWAPCLRSGALIALLASVGCQDATAPANTGALSVIAAFDRTAASGMSGLGNQLAALRRATAPFHDMAVAASAGYNAPLTSCWYYGSEGAMGYHYGKPNLIDDTPDLLNPEILVYAPDPDGELHLVAIEYIVPIPMWAGPEPPSLMGQEFERNDVLGLYALHIWLWRHNPNGMFADWNPKVSCTGAAESEDRSAS